MRASGSQEATMYWSMGEAVASRTHGLVAWATGSNGWRGVQLVACMLIEYNFLILKRIFDIVLTAKGTYVWRRMPLYSYWNYTLIWNWCWVSRLIPMRWQSSIWDDWTLVIKLELKIPWVYSPSASSIRSQTLNLITTYIYKRDKFRTE